MGAYIGVEFLGHGGWGTGMLNFIVKYKLFSEVLYEFTLLPSLRVTIAPDPP